jgi:hypothetical protein
MASQITGDGGDEGTNERLARRNQAYGMLVMPWRTVTRQSALRRWLLAAT